MDQDGASLEVGFVINSGDSFSELAQLEAAMNSAEGKIVREAANIERATGGMLNVGGAVVGFTANTNAASRELASMARQAMQAEKAGESMVRQMNRQIEVFGKSASEVRNMRAEMRAVEAESRGLTELAGRIRSANAAMNQLENGTDGLGGAARRSRGSLTQLSFQLNDIATMAASGAPPFQILATQMGQIVQVAQQADGGLKGLLGEIGGFAVRFAPAIVATTVLAGGIALVHRAISDVDTKPMIAQLGLTDDEIEKLDNTTIGFGDSMTAVFQVGWERIAGAFGTTTDGITKTWNDSLDAITANTRQNVAEIYGLVSSIGGLLDRATSGELDLGSGGADIFSAEYKRMQEEYRQGTQAALRFFDDVGDKAVSNKLADLRKQADAIRKDRVSKVDRHAESLAREAAAIEAQIRNLYGLADAYNKSGAEALVAEARVAAESKAIKARGDVTAAVEREIRLEIAKRVSDTAKSTAGMREQLRAQEEVNGLVAAGLEPVERTNELVQERIAMLPLLAALEVAQARGYVEEVERINRVLDEQRDIQEALRQEQGNAAFNAASASGNTQLEVLREELRLVGATDDARVRALVTLKAMQEAERSRFNPEQTEAYIAQQQEIADVTRQIADENRRIAEEARRLDDQLNDIVGTLGRMGGVGETLAGIFQGIGTGSFAGLGSVGVLFDLLRNNADGEKMADRIAGEISKVFGVSGPFAQTMAKALQGAGIGMMAGSLVGGSGTANQIGSGVGGILGGIAGEAFKGGITNIATSAFGKTLGSAIGTAVPVIGNILGGIAGNLIGGLFGGGSKYGGVSLSGSGISTFGNNGEREGAAGTLGNSVMDGLQRIADQLGATVGNFSTSIGVYKDEFRVNTTGASKVGGYSGSAAENERKYRLYNFGQDEAAAVAFALADAIKDGAIQGLSAASQALLNKGGDLEAQLNKVLQFEGVFSELERMKNPAEAATKQLEAEFAQLKQVFQEAGASAEQYAQLEELRGLKLAELAQQTAGVDDITNRRRELEIELMTAQGNIMGAVAAARAQELAELDPSLRALQQQIWAAQLLNDQRQLEIQLMDAQGNTAGALAARRELELAATDESLRALKTQVWAMQDAQEAARAATELRDAWSSVGDSIMDEVKRIRGLTGGGENSFASLMGQFNAANAAARGGDIDAARDLPGLSQELLRVAQEMATSRQELDRVQAEVAAMLEQTGSMVRGVPLPANESMSDAALVAAAGQTQAAAAQTASNESLIAEVRSLKDEVARLRNENNAGHATNASNTGAVKKHLDNVTGRTGGDAIAVEIAA